MLCCKGVDRYTVMPSLSSSLITGVVNKSGAWYAYEGDKIGQGRENAKQFLKQNPEICHEIEERVREGFGLDSAGTDEEKAEKAQKEKTEAAGKKNAAETAEK